MRFLPDTHCLFWYLSGSSLISSASRRLFDEPGAHGTIIISVVCLSELLYLSRKKSLPISFERTLNFLEKDLRFDIQPLTLSIIRESIPLSRFEIHDALIVATALDLGVPLMTRDEKIRESGLVAILKP